MRLQSPSPGWLLSSKASEFQCLCAAKANFRIWWIQRKSCTCIHAGKMLDSTTPAKPTSKTKKNCWVKFQLTAENPSFLAGGSTNSQTGGDNPKGWDVNLWFGQFFRKTAWICKNLERGGRGSLAHLHAGSTNAPLASEHSLSLSD